LRLQLVIPAAARPNGAQTATAAPATTAAICEVKEFGTQRILAETMGSRKSSQKSAPESTPKAGRRLRSRSRADRANSLPRARPTRSFAAARREMKITPGS